MTEKSEIITVRLADGSTLKVEASPGEGRQKVASPPIFDLADASTTIEQTLVAMSDIVRKAKPSKASLELGFELSVESGKLTAVLVKGAAKANIKVNLEWELPRKEQGHGRHGNPS